VKRRCGSGYFRFCVRALRRGAGFARPLRVFAPRAAGAGLRVVRAGFRAARAGALAR